MINLTWSRNASTLSNMSAKDNQIAFENSLQNGDLVTARWTHKDRRYQAKAKVLDLRDASIAVILVEGGHSLDGKPGQVFERGEERSVPRRTNRVWSIHNCLYTAGEFRECAKEGCKVKISPDDPERKRYCSATCRLEAHRERVDKKQDLPGLISGVDEAVKRVGDLALSRRWGALKRRLGRD